MPERLLDKFRRHPFYLHRLDLDEMINHKPLSTMLSRPLRPSCSLELSIPRECSICRAQLAASFHSHTKLREQEKSTPPSSEPSSTPAKTVSSTRRQRTAQAFNSIQNLQRKPVGLRGGQFL